MTVLDRAKQFVGPGSDEDLIAILRDCVAERSHQALAATQILYEDRYRGIIHNYEMKAPAAFVLAGWGRPGLEALVEGALRTETSKNRSLTLEILATLAAREPLPQMRLWVKDDELTDRIRSAIVDDRTLYDDARELMHRYVLGFTSDDEAAHAVGSSISKHTMFQTIEASKELFGALALRWLAVGQPVIDQFNELIEHSSNNEQAFQQFFTDHPQFLDPMALEIWPQPDLHGFREPDFVIRRTDNTYVVVEIETPAKPLVTGSGQISSQVTQAVGQVVGYRTFLAERMDEARKHFPSFQVPEGLVIVGLQEGLETEQMRVLQMENEHRANVTIVGFDWVRNRMQAVTENLIRRRVGSTPLRMV